MNCWVQKNSKFKSCFFTERGRAVGFASKYYRTIQCSFCRFFNQYEICAFLHWLELAILKRSVVSILKVKSRKVLITTKGNRLPHGTRLPARPRSRRRRRRSVRSNFREEPAMPSSISWKSDVGPSNARPSVLHLLLKIQIVNR